MSAFSPVRRAEVAARAGHRCEYCHLPTRGQVATFPIDHVTPESAGGTTAVGNLALSCPRCNGRKGAAEEGPDPDTGEFAPLLNPRRDDWPSHFAWDIGAPGALAGLTAVGRATIVVLRMNDPEIVQLRRLLADAGLFPEVAAATAPL